MNHKKACNHVLQVIKRGIGALAVTAKELMFRNGNFLWQLYRVLVRPGALHILVPLSKKGYCSFGCSPKEIHLANPVRSREAISWTCILWTLEEWGVILSKSKFFKRFDKRCFHSWGQSQIRWCSCKVRSWSLKPSTSSSWVINESHFNGL